MLARSKLTEVKVLGEKAGEGTSETHPEVLTPAFASCLLGNSPTLPPLSLSFLICKIGKISLTITTELSSLKETILVKL